MDFHQYDAFIFDLDGTLIDSEIYHAQAFADAVLALCGYTLTDEEKGEFFASHSTRFAATLNERHGLHLDPEVVLRHKRSRVKEIFKADLFDGAQHFLEMWHGRKPMGLATNSPLSFVQTALEAAGLLHYFKCITTADEVAHRKPDPEMIIKTLEKLETAPARTLVFEDQLIGIAAAQAAGAAVVAVNNGQPVTFPDDVEVITWDSSLL